MTYLNPRRIALDILLRIDKEDTFADILLKDVLNREVRLKQPDKALIHELLYGTLRWRFKIDHAIGCFSSKPVPKLDPETLAILRLGTYQLLYLDRIPPHAAVDESVKLTLNYHGGRAKAFVNAILRTMNKERDRIRYPAEEPDLAYHLAVKHSHPKWLVANYLERMPREEVEKLLHANNQVPPKVIRTNTLKISRDELKKTLSEEGCKPVNAKFSPEGLYLKEAPPIQNLSAFHEGLFQVQDESSQLVSHILQVEPSMKVLEVCAAPGGKTTHLAALMNDEGEIHAIDSSPSRLEMVEGAAKRLGIKSITTKRADATLTLRFDRNYFDRVLVDAPCSGLGTVRRNPDLKWKKRPEGAEELAELQAAILENAAKYVNKKGALVYSVCTINHRENELVVKKFLENARSFKLDRTLGGLKGKKKFQTEEGHFMSWPHIHNTDGFFAARFVRVLK